MFHGDYARLRRFIGVVLIVFLLGIILAWLFAKPKHPTTAEAMAKASTQPATIVVGTNLQVSTANASIAHKEAHVAVNPLHPQHLVAFSIYSPPGRSSACIVGYLSEDGGTTWRSCFENQTSPGEYLCDPSIAFASDGLLYLAYHQATGDRPEEAGRGPVVFFRSADGGQKWEAVSRVAHAYTDRPFIAVDCSAGRCRGRLYCVSAGAGTSLQLDLSADHGQTFNCVTWPWKHKGVDLCPANPVALPDGTLVLGHRIWSGMPDDRPGLRIILSDDGGKTLREASPVSTDWYDERIKTANFWFVPQLAADSSSARYVGRLYAVWEDGSAIIRGQGQPHRPGPVRILFAFSKDKGRSWLGPAILSEQPAAGQETYSAHMPTIAVSEDGYVGVMWYDRRGLPPADGKSPFYPRGCNVRLRVSLDGGQTWQPSVQVNENPIQSAVQALKDTPGLAAGAAGTFHPVWIDDRTGTRQVWTATVRVQSYGKGREP